MNEGRTAVFAQLTWRESLRALETCLASFGPKLYHAGTRAKKNFRCARRYSRPAAAHRLSRSRNRQGAGRPARSGNRIAVSVNGPPVNECCDVWPAAGKILLTTEGFAILFRKFELHPLPKATK
jgi:hypothetical protein